MTPAQRYANHRQMAIAARREGRIQTALMHEGQAEDLHDAHESVTLELVEHWDEEACQPGPTT
jgi:hypothetical protein